jgi:hypothetical protein
MADEFLSLTDLGRLYGVSSHKMGRWLVDLRLRTTDKKPSDAAFAGGYVAKRDSRQPGTYYWVWHREKTKRLLRQAGHRPLGDEVTTGDDQTGPTRSQDAAAITTSKQPHEAMADLNTFLATTCPGWKLDTFVLHREEEDKVFRVGAQPDGSFEAGYGKRG